MLKAVLVDDISEARENLKRDLADYCPDVEILGEADGVVAGAKLIRQLKPELVFLDIEMPDGTGFDLLEIVQDLDFKLIFTTGSDQHAIRAFRFAAIDYLLKPLDPDDLVEAVKRASEAQPLEQSSLEVLKEQMQPSGNKQRIALHTLEKIHIVEVADIVRCESSVNYTLFYLSDQRQLLVTRTLKEFEKLLEPQGFVRVHQSHLVNADHMKEFVKINGGYLVLKDGSNVPVSGRKKAVLMEVIAGM